jgi:hypothetical protein
VKDELARSELDEKALANEHSTRYGRILVLWDLAQQVVLTERDDEISWRWSADGAYSSKSAYLAQFTGSYATFQGSDIWKAHAEGKHKFFTWLLVQSKILTTDKLIKRSWPCDPVCKLCNQE